MKLPPNLLLIFVLTFISMSNWAQQTSPPIFFHDFRLQNDSIHETIYKNNSRFFERSYFIKCGNISYSSQIYLVTSNVGDYLFEVYGNPIDSIRIKDNDGDYIVTISSNFKWKIIDSTFKTIDSIDHNIHCSLMFKRCENATINDPDSLTTWKNDYQKIAFHVNIDSKGNINTYSINEYATTVFNLYDYLLAINRLSKLSFNNLSGNACYPGTVIINIRPKD